MYWNCDIISENSNKELEFIFNNIKWTGSWEIYHENLSSVLLELGQTIIYLRLIHENESIDIGLKKQVSFRLKKKICRMSSDEEYWITKLVAKPNELLHMIFEEFTGKKGYEIVITKSNKDNLKENTYEISLWRRTREFNYEGSYLLNQANFDLNELKEEMEAFPKYIDIFPFSLPLGVFFQAEIDNKNKW